MTEAKTPVVMNISFLSAYNAHCLWTRIWYVWSVNFIDPASRVTVLRLCAQPGVVSISAVIVTTSIWGERAFVININIKRPGQLPTHPSTSFCSFRLVDFHLQKHDSTSGDLWPFSLNLTQNNVGVCKGSRRLTFFHNWQPLFSHCARLALVDRERRLVICSDSRWLRYSHTTSVVITQTNKNFCNAVGRHVIIHSRLWRMMQHWLYTVLCERNSGLMYELVASSCGRVSRIYCCKRR